MSLDLKLGKAYSFASFNKTSKTLIINLGALSLVDVGKYEIQLQARYKNLTYTEDYKTSFTLVIKSSGL